MAQVAVVTDTTHYIPAAMLAEHDIRQVSLYVRWDGRVDRESSFEDYDEFYEKLRTASELPTTSQPSVGDFIEVWEPLLDEGREIVSVHLSGGISGTYETGLQAKSQLEEERRGGERVTVVDSHSACGGLGFLVLAAAAAASRGGSRRDVVERVEAAHAAVKVWFAVDTLEFLRRGGRIGGAQAWLGAALKIKPILSIDEQITPIERVRTSSRALERMVDYLRSRKEDGADAWGIQHIQDPERAAVLVERGREIFGSEPLFVSEIGPVIGAHTGPGVLGVGGIPAALLR